MRRALEKVDGIQDIETNTKDNTCTFSATAKMDVDSVLNKIVEDGNKHIAGWSKVE